MIGWSVQGRVEMPWMMISMPCLRTLASSKGQGRAGPLAGAHGGARTAMWMELRRRCLLLSQAWDALDALGKRDEGENYAR